MKLSRKEIGAWGEQQAAAYLEKSGYQILEQNYRTPYGEVDIITRKGGCLVFVEVKTRTSVRFGFPEEAVGEEKLAHLLDSAAHYLIETDQDLDWRVDVIAINKNQQKGNFEIKHFENVTL